MRKRDSKRRWKARLKLGKWIPMQVMAEHQCLQPKANDYLVNMYRQYVKWMNKE